jgi:hypothetical protein
MKPPTTEDLLRCQDILTILENDLQIDFKIKGDAMTRDQATDNFTKRKALAISMNLLIDRAEALSS